MAESYYETRAISPAAGLFPSLSHHEGLRDRRREHDRAQRPVSFLQHVELSVTRCQQVRADLNRKAGFLISQSEFRGKLVSLSLGLSRRRLSFFAIFHSRH